MEDNFDDKELYTLAVLRYKEENPNLNAYNLFSSDWNLCKDYSLKIKIIAEAIKKHIFVEETELYKEKILEKSE